VDATSDLIRLDPADSVAVCRREVAAGESLSTQDGAVLLVLDDVPQGHKVATRAHAAGDSVVKYGSPIGVAREPIPAGRHVHSHNLVTVRGRRADAT
jgi:altronate hydrolase